VDGKRRKERTWERQAGLVLNIPNMHIIIFTPQYHVLALEMHITIILFTWFNQPETRRDEKIKNVYISKCEKQRGYLILFGTISNSILPAWSNFDH
jgi:hypothetical protein